MKKYYFFIINLFKDINVAKTKKIDWHAFHDDTYKGREELYLSNHAPLPYDIAHKVLRDYISIHGGQPSSCMHRHSGLFYHQFTTNNNRYIQTRRHKRTISSSCSRKLHWLRTAVLDLHPYSPAESINRKIVCLKTCPVQQHK